MIVRVSKEVAHRIRNHMVKTGIKKPSIAIERIVNAVVDLSEENRRYLFERCLERYNEINAIDVDDGDYETDRKITEDMRQLLYLSFIFKEEGEK